MALSTEAIIAILAIIVNLPPTGLVIWKLFRRAGTAHQHASSELVTCSGHSPRLFTNGYVI